MSNANLKTTLSLDTKRFDKALSRAKRAIARFKTAMRALGRAIPKVIKVIAALVAVISATSVGMAFGIKKAIDYGSAVSDISAQTGMASKNVVLWGEALRQGGLEADELGNIVNKLQKSVAEAIDDPKGKKAGIFENLGIDPKSLRELSTGDMLGRVAQRVGKIGDQVNKVHNLTGLFEESGPKMLTVFGDPEALERARRTMFTTAGLIEKNANTMDRISDVIGSIGVKIRSFFIGFSDGMLGTLQDVTAKLEAIDFAQMGRDFAKLFEDIPGALAKLFDVLKSGVVMLIFEVIALIKPVFEAMFDVAIGKLGDAFPMLAVGGKEEPKPEVPIALQNVEKLLKSKDPFTRQMAEMLMEMHKNNAAIEDILRKSGLMGAEGEEGRVLDPNQVKWRSKFQSSLHELFPNFVPDPELSSEEAERRLQAKIDAVFPRKRDMTGLPFTGIQEVNKFNHTEGGTGFRDSALDDLLRRRQQVRQRDGIVAKSNAPFNTSTTDNRTEMADGRTVFGGGSAGFTTPFSSGNIGKMLDVFGSSPSEDQRAKNRKRMETGLVVDPVTSRSHALMRKQLTAVEMSLDEMKKLNTKLTDAITVN